MNYSTIFPTLLSNAHWHFFPKFLNLSNCLSFSSFSSWKFLSCSSWFSCHSLDGLCGLWSFCSLEPFLYFSLGLQPMFLSSSGILSHGQFPCLHSLHSPVDSREKICCKCIFLILDWKCFLLPSQLIICHDISTSAENHSFEIWKILCHFILPIIKFIKYCLVISFSILSTYIFYWGFYYSFAIHVCTLFLWRQE